MTLRTLLALVVTGALLSACRGGPSPAAQPTPLAYVTATEPVGEDADDMAIWVNRAAPAESRIVATNKTAAPAGALVVLDLAGRIRQRVTGIDRPNNVDLEYGFRLGGEAIDLVVVTERYQRRLRAFRVQGDGTLAELPAEDGLRVFAGEVGERGAPMGVGLYRRPSDGVVFAILSRKETPRSGALWQYLLEDDGRGRVRAVKVRELGTIEAGSEVEAIVVDDALGHVYFSEEPKAIHKWRADPGHHEAGVEVARFGRTEFRGEREGLAIYARSDGTGHLLASDQREGASRYLVFRRQGSPLPPHANQLVTVLEGGADATDGIDATSESLGPRFPHGVLVVLSLIHI